MKRNIIHKLTASMMIAAGILIGVPDDIFAQSQSQSKSTSQQTQSHSDHGASHGASKNKTQAAAKNNSMNSKSDEAMFVKKASEANLTEIKLGELAMEKGSTNEVREYGQMMVKDHTMAQTQLAQIVSNYSTNAANKPAYMNDDANDTGDANKMSSMGATGGTTGNSMAEGKTNGQYNSSQTFEGENKENDANNKPNASGATTATGSTYSSGNASGAVSTTDKISGRSADGAASNNSSMTNESSDKKGNDANANSTTNPSMSGTRVGRGSLTEPTNTAPAGTNNAQTESDGTGGGGPGANSGATTSSNSTGRTGRANAGADVGVPSQANGSSNDAETGGNTNLIENPMAYDLPTELSAEHKALRDKLAKLSGEEFDKAYLQAMVKDHEKTVAIFEKQSMADNEKAMPKDDQLKTYASNMLPYLKRHHEKAQMLLGGGKTNNSPAKEGIK